MFVFTMHSCAGLCEQDEPPAAAQQTDTDAGVQQSAAVLHTIAVARALRLRQQLLQLQCGHYTRGCAEPVHSLV
jgi:hypothetical protein